MSKIDMFKVKAYLNGYDSYWNILPTEIHNEIFRFEHKNKLYKVLNECDFDDINIGVCCNCCNIPCDPCYLLCTFCHSFAFCPDCYELIFEHDKIRKVKRIYGSYKYYPVCQDCKDKGNCDNYYFGNCNIKRIY